MIETGRTSELKFLTKRRIRTAEEKKEIKNERLLAVISGAMLAVAFPPFGLPYIALVALIPLLYLLEKRRSLNGQLKITYLWGFSFNLLTLYWVGSWTKEADPFLMLSGAALMFFNPLTFLVPSALYHMARRRFGKSSALLMLPFFWAFYEYLYSLTDFRFPWLMLANSLPKFTSFIQIADIIGAPGLGILLLYINIFFYLAYKEFMQKDRNWKFPFAAALLFLLAPVLYGNYKIKTYEPSKDMLRVGLIQPNLDPWDKWAEGSAETILDGYFRQSDEAAKSGASLIVWPETALPVYLLSGNNPELSGRIRDYLAAHRLNLLTGMPDLRVYSAGEKMPAGAKPVPGGDLYYGTFNSVLLFSWNDPFIQRYGKMKLVPFGEKVPLVNNFPMLGRLIKWGVGISSWNEGMDTTVFSSEKRRFAGIVCIESIYPDFVSSFVKKGAGLIFIVTNDSWYGNSSGPYQHQEIAALRAVENRRTVLRCANGGISCMIDPMGRTVTESSMFSKAVLVINAPLDYRLSFYTVHPLIIPYISLSLSLITMMIYGLSFIRRKYNHKP